MLDTEAGRRSVLGFGTPKESQEAKPEAMSHVISCLYCEVRIDIIEQWGKFFQLFLASSLN